MAAKRTRFILVYEFITKDAHIFHLSSSSFILFVKKEPWNFQFCLALKHKERFLLCQVTADPLVLQPCYSQSQIRL